MSEFKPIPMIGIREHDNGQSIYLSDHEDSGRLVLSVRDVGVSQCCAIDLMDLIGWLSQNKDLVMGLRETP